MNSVRTLLLTSIIAVSFSLTLVGQTYFDQIGLPQFSAPQPVETGFINLSNGNLHLEIPISSVELRGGKKLISKLVYDSMMWRLWYGSPVYPGVQWFSDNGGWRFVESAGGGTVTYATSPTPCPVGSGNYYDYNNFVFTEADGTARQFPIRTENYPCTGGGGNQNPSGTAYALDGSGYYMSVTNYTNATVWAPDGAIVNGATQTDTNGNNWYGGIDGNGNTVDEFGRVPVALRGSGSYTTYYDVRASDGSTVTYTAQFEDIPVNTYFQAPGGVAEYNGTIKVLQSLTLPTGRSYSFGYDSGTSQGHYGAVTSITLPTGGQISYSYQLVPNANGYNQLQVASRNNGFGNWAYTWQPLGSCTACKLTVGDSTNDTVYSFTSFTEYPTQIQYFQGRSTSGAIAKTVSIDYDSNARPYRVTNSYPNGQTSKSEYTYDSSLSGVRIITDERDWDYYSGAPPANPLRHIAVSYKRDTPYVSAHILNKPQSKTVYDVNGVQSSQTTFSYDDFPLTNVTGASGHDDVHYGVGVTVRGNLTTKADWVSTTGGYLMTTWHYDTLGNPTYSTDPASTLRQTTYDYSDVWADSSCIGAGTVARAFPTTVTDPAGFQRKTSYYTCTGLLHSTRDQNDINAGRAGTTMSYDEVNRPLTTNYPDGGQASLNYNGDPVPPSVTKTQLASPDPSIVSTTVLDGLGRVAHSQLNSDPEGVDYTDTTYDALGHVLTTSNAYRTVASAATDGTYCNGTKNNGACISGYDALGRLTISTKQDGSVVRTDYSAYPTVTVTDEAGRQRQTVTDALGRLVDVYEPNPTTGSLTSGSFHTHYTFDVLGNLKQVIQYGNGTPRTRTFDYDSISRLIDATTPESGTITYSYAADTTCNPNGVDLRTKTDARGITTTYCYDVLHRVTQQAYSDGTPQVTFNYDEPNPFGFNGVAANTIGRLSSEFTGVSPHLSGTGFAYDAVGRIVFQGQCGKSNCGTGNVPSSPYQVSASYDLAGNINSFNYPSTRSLSQTNSGAGRLLTVNYAYFNGLSVNYSYLNVPIGSTPQTWGYMPPGLLQIENKGNGTVDTISYNSRLQMSQVTGGSTARTWFNRSIDYGTANNGNVQHVYDNLSSGRSQTFGYDQINRIVSASTTATTGPDAWSETFNSDAWGNVTQSGSDNFNQAFNSNNQIVGYSYDAAGCLLSDTFHTYAYDAECRITSVDLGSATYIYGADGQRTRKDYAGDWTEYVYFKGQPIAEVNSSGDWTDYVYANGKRIAEAEALNRDLHIYGTTTGSGQYAVFNFANTAGLNGYTIHSGDTLYLAQYQPTGSKGGMILSFTDGSNSNWSVTDQYGYYLNDDQHQTPTYMRQIDLSSLAGKTINKVAVNDEDDTAAGSWNIYFDDISLVSSDGTVHPIYTGETSASLSLGSHTSGETSLGSKIDTNRGKATHVNDTTTYYTADHLGSARMITAPRGYPIWSGVFLPYGEEWNPQITMNHYKLTGKERDSENGAPGNGLDYFGARYYSSAMGRWMTPDWAEQDELDALPSGDAADPQTLNLYAYVRNNPVSQVDPDGHHQECVTTMTLEYSKDHKEAVYQVHTDCHEILDPTPVTVVSRFQIALNRLINGGNALGPGGRAEIQDYCGANALVPSVCYDMWSHLGPLLPSGELPFALSTKPAIVPKNWTEKPTYKNDGRIYIDPTNTHNRVRVMDDGYMKVQKNGQTLDVNGNPVPSSSPEAHIPVNSVMESPFEGPFE